MITVIYFHGLILLFIVPPFHPSSAIGPHALYPVHPFQTSAHPVGSLTPGITAGSHSIGQIGSLHRDSIGVYRGS